MKMNYLTGINFPFESYNHQFQLDENGDISHSFEECGALEKIFHIDDLYDLYVYLWDSIDDEIKAEMLEEINEKFYDPFYDPID